MAEVKDCGTCLHESKQESEYPCVTCCDDARVGDTKPWAMWKPKDQPEPDADEPTEDEDVCFNCHGSGGGAPPMTCNMCRGTGRSPFRPEEDYEP